MKSFMKQILYIEIKGRMFKIDEKHTLNLIKSRLQNLETILKCSTEFRICDNYM